MGELILTPKALHRALLSRAIRHPATLTTGAIAGVFGGLTAVSGGMVAASLAALFAAATLGSFLYHFVAVRSRHARAYIDTVEAARERERRAQLGGLRARLFDMADGADGNALAARALEQYQRLHRYHDAFGQTLDKKLNVGELTYVRYLDGVERAYQSVVSNLTRCADQISLLRDGHAQAGTVVEAVLAQNDSAIIALGETAAAVASMRDLEDAGDERIERIIDDLAALAARTQVR